MHVAGMSADARTFEHLDPEVVGNEREMLISELAGMGRCSTARSRPTWGTSTRRPPRARSSIRSRSASISGYQYEAADASLRAAAAPGGGRLRAAVPAGELPRDRREARGRPGRAPRPRSRSGSTASATCAPPRETARSTRSTSALREAITDRHPHLADIELTNYKVRILDERPRHRRGHPRAARLLRRRARVGLDRRLREHHRGLLGGAGRVAGVRVPAAREESSRNRPAASQLQS